MTPEQRAENIKKTFLPLVDLGPSLVDFIAASIREAVEQAEAEGYIRGVIDGEHRGEMKWVKRGRAAALEEAAKICDEHAEIKGLHLHDGFKFCVQEVADKIRERAKEVQ